MGQIQTFSGRVSLGVAGIGFSVLVGWGFGLPVLKNLHPNLVAMNPVTACFFILSGLAAWLLRAETVGQGARRTAWAFAGIVVLGALLIFGGQQSELFPRLDQLLFRGELEKEAIPNRMAPNTELGFLLAGLSLLLLDVETPRGRRPGQHLALATGLMAFLVLTGYLYSATALFRVRSYIPMAVSTAVAFALLSIGILGSRPDRGFVRVLTIEDAGAGIARRLLPAAIGVPFLLGWLCVEGEQRGLFGAEFADALMVVLTVVILGVAVWWNAMVIGRADTDRKQAEEEIRGLNEALKRHTAELEAANKELEAFSYSVSHDLRAPLRAIDGFGLALLEDSANRLDDQGKNYLDRIRAATKRMAHLIDDLLDLSRLAREEMRLDDVNLSAMATAVLAELRNREPERQVECIIPEGIVVRGDARLLRVVLVNLLGNSWKFTSKKPSARIEFGLTRQDGLPVYFVRDNGAGFDMKRVEKLFGAFQRLHGVTEFPGTGIGLATVRRIIHRHGGRVWADGAEGQGATFWFTLSTSRERPMEQRTARLGEDNLDAEALPSGRRIGS